MHKESHKEHHNTCVETSNTNSSRLSQKQEDRLQKLFLRYFTCTIIYFNNKSSSNRFCCTQIKCKQSELVVKFKLKA